MSDRPDDISKEAWEAACGTWEALTHAPSVRDEETAIVARAIDRARRKGYATGVRAAAEVAETEFENWQTRQESSVNDCYAHAIRTASAIRALDGKGDGNG
jgi:hypothetical protein